MDIRSIIFGILITLFIYAAYMLIKSVIKFKNRNKGYDFIKQAYSDNTYAFRVEMPPIRFKELTDNIYDEEVYEITYYDSESTEALDSIDDKIDEGYTFEKIKQFINK